MISFPPKLLTNSIKPTQNFNKMYKPILLFILFCFSIRTGNSQILKDTWLIGGSADFSQLKSSKDALAQTNQKDLKLNAVVGYFPIDKFAIGLKPSLIFGSNSVGNTFTIIGVGPFIRYYFLSGENRFNLFTEGGYSYGNISGKGLDQNQNSNTFSAAGGTVLYLNSSVGIEFTLSYATTKVVDFVGKNNELKFGVGFMFYLEKND